MSNVLQKAFYLSRPQEPACLGLAPSAVGKRRLRSRCGAAFRQDIRVIASATLVANWQPPSLVAFYAAGAVLRANVSSAAAKPAPLIRPAQSVCGPLAATPRQQR